MSVPTILSLISFAFVRSAPVGLVITAVGSFAFFFVLFGIARMMTVFAGRREFALGKTTLRSYSHRYHYVGATWRPLTPQRQIHGSAELPYAPGAKDASTDIPLIVQEDQPGRARRTSIYVFAALMVLGVAMIIITIFAKGRGLAPLLVVGSVLTTTMAVALLVAGLLFANSVHSRQRLRRVRRVDPGSLLLVAISPETVRDILGHGGIGSVDALGVLSVDRQGVRLWQPGVPLQLLLTIGREHLLPIQEDDADPAHPQTRPRIRIVSDTGQVALLVPLASPSLGRALPKTHIPDYVMTLNETAFGPTDSPT